MNVLIIGGFLGSGKTTVVRSLIRQMVARGSKCAIIENEIGEVGIDDALVGEAGLEVTQLFGGCVCCTISGNLVAAVKRIEDEVDPDWVIVEMTGLALMADMKKLFGYYPGEGLGVFTVSVVDVSRWKILTGPLVQVFDAQVEGADVVLLNKVDVAAPGREVYDGIRERCETEHIIECSEQILAQGTMWATLLDAFGVEG